LTKKNESPEGLFLCGLCGEAFKNKKDLGTHIKNSESLDEVKSEAVIREGPDGLFICGFCGDAYKNKRDLRTHIRAAHHLQVYEP
jgi:uncharacterized C2H2 Zn-finger protein